MDEQTKEMMDRLKRSVLKNYEVKNSEDFQKKFSSLEENDIKYFEYRTSQLLNASGTNTVEARNKALQETLFLKEVVPPSGNKDSWQEEYAFRLKAQGDEEQSRILLLDKEKEQAKKDFDKEKELGVLDIASAGMAVYGGPAGVALDVVGKEMIGGESKIKKVGRAAVDKVKQAKMSVDDMLNSVGGPFGKLEKAYIDEKESKDNKRSSRFIRKKNEWIKSLKRKQENLKKQVQQIEKKLSSAKNSAEVKRLREERQLLVDTIVKDNNALKTQMHEKEMYERNRNNVSKKFKERERYHREFKAMTDDEKVLFAHSLSQKGISAGSEFLETVKKDGEKLNMTRSSQVLAQELTGDKETSVLSVARDRAAANKMARDNNLRSTYENAQISDMLENETGDIRQSFAVKDEAKSTKSTKEHLAKSGRGKDVKEAELENERDNYSRGR